VATRSQLKLLLRASRSPWVAARGRGGCVSTPRDRATTSTRSTSEELGEPWEVVAQYLGDKLTTVLNHYVRAGEDALRDSVAKLTTR
jgi:hypothetical protein